MWKATAGTGVKVAANASEGDDWETDPDFVVCIHGVSGGIVKWGWCLNYLRLRVMYLKIEAYLYSYSNFYCAQKDMKKNEFESDFDF